jgi:hypothetical protein
MRRVIKNAVKERASGKRQSAPRALVVAAAAGAAAAGQANRVMRS